MNIYAYILPALTEIHQWASQIAAAHEHMEGLHQGMLASNPKAQQLKPAFPNLTQTSLHTLLQYKKTPLKLLGSIHWQDNILEICHMAVLHCLTVKFHVEIFSSVLEKWNHETPYDSSN